MNASSPTDNRPAAVDRSARRRALSAAVDLAVSGVDAGTLPGALRNANTASAFVRAADAQPVDLGPGLWAMVRSSPDGMSRVLCVHNVSGVPRSFTPDPYLRLAGEAPGASLVVLFLHGEITTREGSDGCIRCDLHPLTFVWLGRFIDSVARGLPAVRPR